MGRSLGGRVVLAGGLVFDELVHVGGMNSAAGFDALPVRDGLDRYVIPGTSVVGVLRSWVENLNEMSPTWPTATIERVFGGTGDDSTGAALLRVDDVVLEGMDTELVDGVGIDRFTGAAADGVKFDKVALRQRPGSRAAFRLVLAFGDGASDRDGAVDLVRTLAAALHHGRLRVGASTVRGFGAFSLKGTNGEGVPKMAVQTHDRAGVLERLSGRERLNLLDDLAEPTRGEVVIEVGLAALTPTFVKSSVEGTLVDTIPRSTVRGGRPYLVIPGTSVKGVLRSELERIERTITGIDVAEGDPHHQQVRTPLADAMFGFTDASHDDTVVSVGRRGVVRIDDVLGGIARTDGRALDVEAWDTVLRMANKAKNPRDAGADRAAIVDGLRVAGLGDWQVTDHVAIDRWTSGAAESKLFSVLEPHGVEWSPLRITLDTSRASAPGDTTDPLEPDRAVAAIVMALHSLHRGDIGLGWGTMRGHGSVCLTSLTIRGLDGLDDLRVEGIGRDRGLLSEIARTDATFVGRLRSAWTGEVAP